MMHSLPLVSHIYIWWATITQRLVYLDKTRSVCQSNLSVSVTPLHRDAKYDKTSFLRQAPQKKTSCTLCHTQTQTRVHLFHSPPISLALCGTSRELMEKWREGSGGFRVSVGATAHIRRNQIKGQRWICLQKRKALVGLSRTRVEYRHLDCQQEKPLSNVGLLHWSATSFPNPSPQHQYS